jgi:aminoglycoside phosphotransferase (APT) family kinase protein
MIKYYSMEISTLKNVIPNANRWVQIEQIHKGWSFEYKYKVIDSNHQASFLRIATIDKFESKQIEYKTLNQLIQLNLNLSIPYEIGTSLDSNYVYTLSNWIVGDDTSLIINKLPKYKQYKLGIEAGRLLNEVHKVQIEKPSESWNDRYTRKINRKIELMKACSIQLEHHDLFLKCIYENKALINDRDYCFQHGDFHIGNTLFNSDQSLSLIDFDRLDFGDPWEEFNRMPLSVEISPEYATGCIDGYFNHKIPENFFPLLALYTAVNHIGSIPWAMNYGELEINNMIRLARLTLEWYDNFDTYIPKWYKANITEESI